MSEPLSDKVLSFSHSIQGRDKALKFLQYLTKLIRAMWMSKYTLNFQVLSSAIQNTRKVFRLGRTFTQLKELEQAYENVHYDRVQRSLQSLRMVSLSLRWLFDNLNVLSLFKILKFNAKKSLRFATGFWLVSLILNLIDCSREMMKSYAREANIKEESVGKSTFWVIQQLDRLSEKRRVTILEMTRTIGDIIVASNSAEVPYLLLGKQFSDKWVAIAGIVASIINCYQASCSLR